MTDPMPLEVDVPDGDYEVPQDEDWYPDWNDENEGSDE